GGERSTREAGGIGPDRRGDEGEAPAGDLRAVPGRGPRVREAAESHVGLRDRRGVSRAAPRGAIGAGGRRFRGLERAGTRRRRVRAGARSGADGEHNGALTMDAARDITGYRKYWAARFGTAPFLPMTRAEMTAL